MWFTGRLLFNGFIELSPEELDFVSGGHHDIIRGAIDGGFYGGLAGAAGSGGDPHVTIHSAIGGAAAGAARAASGRVICTHFYRKGMLSKELWRADLEYTFSKISSKTVRGYQYWAIPYVRLMKKSQLAEKIMYPLAKYRAIEIAYQMGVVDKGSLRGKIIRNMLEPVCFIIGSLVKEQEWESLWKEGSKFNII